MGIDSPSKLWRSGGLEISIGASRSFDLKLDPDQHQYGSNWWPGFRVPGDEGDPRRGKTSRKIVVNSEPLSKLNGGTNELSEFSAWDGIFEEDLSRFFCLMASPRLLLLSSNSSSFYFSVNVCLSLPASNPRNRTYKQESKSSPMNPPCVPCFTLCPRFHFCEHK
jgi:hypothetical protein